MSVKIPILTDYDARGVKAAEASLSGLQKLGASAGASLGSALLPAAVSAGALAEVLSSSVKAAMEDAASQEQLAGVLKRTTAATTDNVAQAEKFVKTLSKQTATADDDLRPALARLVNATHNQSDAQRLLVISQNVAAASGKDLETVTGAVSKAYNGNFKALKMLDPSLTAVIKSGASFTSTMKTLAETTAGAAANAANTTAGRMEALHIAIGETQKAIGGAFIPVLNKLLPYLTRTAAFIEKNSNLFLIATGVLLGTSGAFLTFTLAMKAYGVATKVATGMQELFNAVMRANPYVKVALVIATVVSALVVLYKTSDTVRNGFQTLARVVVQAINYVVEAAGHLLQSISNFVAGFIGTIGNLVGKLGFIPGIGDKFTAASAMIKDASTSVKDFGKNFEGLKLPSFDKISAFAGSLKATVVKSFGAAGSAAGAAFTDNGVAAMTSPEAVGTFGGAAAKATAAAKKSASAKKSAATTATMQKLDSLSFKLGLNNQVGPLSGYNAASIAADKERVKAAAAKMKTAGEEAARIVGSAFATVVDKSMKAFNGETAAGLDRMSKQFDTQVAGIRARLATQLAAVTASLASTMDAINQQESALTPAEQALQAAEAARTQMMAARTLTDAEKQLADARTTGSESDVAKAELDLADVRQNQAIDALTVQAKAERDAATERFRLARDNAQALATQTQDSYQLAAQAEEINAQNTYDTMTLNYKAERDLQEEHLALQLDALKTNLEKQPAAWEDIHGQIMSLFSDSFGPDYKNAGANMGTAFVTGLLESFGKVGAAAIAATPSLTTAQTALTSSAATITAAKPAAQTVINVNGVLTEANAGQAIVNALRRFNQVTGPINIKVA